MEDRFIEIPLEFQDVFPVCIDNMRVELIDSVDGKKYIHERCVVWRSFLDKFDNEPERKESLMPLYNYVLQSDEVSIVIKKEILDIL